MLGSPKLRKAIAAATAAQGLLSLLFPKRMAKLGSRLLLGMSYENTGELEPRDWYVDSTRASGLGMLVGGLFGYILADRAGDSAAAAAVEESEDAAEDAASDEEDDDDDGPVMVDIDE
ncbi:hypothetical protein [Haloarchaeobius iranensis]|uniref:DUF6199 domain-containing protein n=1 Tax=Haloarchaeobius iranensis TaxID=996166 RepID=A0A1G9ZH48_9EURY|nr:hypothetical protein [Haloarchaeobius iranensis]SDN19916.1 hypothetical protein SAMN05192554_12017 [Haloarchaeobius iranensis]